MNKLLTTFVIVGILGAGVLFFSKDTNAPVVEVSNEEPTLGLQVCNVTHSIVAIGNEAPTLVSSSTPGRTWAIVQQIHNATNTVSVYFGTLPTLAQASTSGYSMYPLTSGSGAYATANSEVRFGFATNLPTQTNVYAVSSNGSTTVKFIECK